MAIGLVQHDKSVDVVGHIVPECRTGAAAFHLAAASVSLDAAEVVGAIVVYRNPATAATASVTRTVARRHVAASCHQRAVPSDAAGVYQNAASGATATSRTGARTAICQQLAIEHRLVRHEQLDDPTCDATCHLTFWFAQQVG